jgi:hypothetical protein
MPWKACSASPVSGNICHKLYARKAHYLSIQVAFVPETRTPADSVLVECSGQSVSLIKAFCLRSCTARKRKTESQKHYAGCLGTLSGFMCKHDVRTCKLAQVTTHPETMLPPCYSPCKRRTVHEQSDFHPEGCMQSSKTLYGKQKLVQDSKTAPVCLLFWILLQLSALVPKTHELRLRTGDHSKYAASSLQSTSRRQPLQVPHPPQQGY